MKQEGNMYYAGEEKLIVRKADNFIMGDAIDIGSADSIENYEEKDFTEEEIEAFYDAINVKNEKTREEQI